MLSNLNNFSQSNATENFSNLIQIALPNVICHIQHIMSKNDADAEYLSRVKLTISSHVGGINFTDPFNTRKAYKELINQV